MFLTGQLNPKPWQEPPLKQPHIPKTIDFYGSISHQNNKNNLWDNQYRTSNKTYSFYQQSQLEKQHTLKKQDKE